jgi:ElaB/YqjD/DUF883 family membrane-anchored ribosome-binding protein
MTMKVLSKVAESATIASRELEEQREALAATATRLVDGTCKYVAAHPLQSLGLALMAGYVIGRLSGRLAR